MNNTIASIGQQALNQQTIGNTSLPGVAAGNINYSQGSVYTGYTLPSQNQYYGNGYYYSQPTSLVEPDVTLRKVENGWIIKMQGKEYVITETNQVEKYLTLFDLTK